MRVASQHRDLDEDDEDMMSQSEGDLMGLAKGVLFGLQAPWCALVTGPT